MIWTFVINTIFAIALGVIRIIGIKHEAFQAIAHLYVGGLFTAGWFSRKLRDRATGGDQWEADRASRFYYGVAIVLSVVEVVCAIMFIKQGK